MNPNDSSKFDELYFFGGRGISVFNAADMSLVYESDNMAEFLQALLHPDVFNADLNSEDLNKKPKDFRDQRSARKVWCYK